MNFLTASVVIKADTYGLKAELARAKTMVGRTMAKIRLSVNAAFDKMKRYARMAGLAIAASLVASLKAFASFDDAMTKSLAIMSGVTAEMRAEMEGVARSLALTTTKSATELAKAYFYLASAGLGYAQSLKAIVAVERFATAGTFDLSAATEMAVGSQAALGLASKNAAVNLKNLIRVTDVLVTANELSQASVSQFAEALTNEAAAAMKIWNIELEEGVAVLAAYAKQNIKGAEGGSAFGRMLRFMMMGARQNAEAWKHFNLELYDARTKNLRPLADVIEDMTNLLSNMSVEQKGVTLDLLGFQARSQQVILPLLGMSNSIREWNKRLKEAGGHTKELAEKNLKSFSAQMKIVWNNIVDVGIAIGRKLSPSIISLGELIKENREFIKQWALSVIQKIELVIRKFLDLIRLITTDFKKGMGALKEIVITVMAAVVDTFLIAGIAAGKAFWRGIGMGKPSSKEIFERFKAEGGVGGFLEPDIRARIERELMIEQLREEINVVEQLKIVWEEAGKAISDAIPKARPLEPKGARLGREASYLIGTEAVEAAKAVENVIVDTHQETIDKMTEADEVYINNLQQWWWDLGRVWTDSLNQLGDYVGDFASEAESHLSGAFNDFFTEAKSWGEAMEGLFQNVLKSFISMISDMVAQAVMFAMIKAALGIYSEFAGAGAGAEAVAGGGSASPTMPDFASAQEGGTVKRTGLALVHKDEKITPAGSSGSIDVRIHNEGSENLTISRSESYMVSDQRIIDVYIKASENSGPFRKAMRR